MSAAIVPDTASPAAALRPVQAYKNAISRNFAFLKHTAQIDDLLAKGIPLKDGLGCLVPVAELHVDDEVLIGKLAEWRRDSATAFPTQFLVTIEGTKNWLRVRLLDVEDRLLFLVLDKHGYPVGHLGFANCLNDECAMEVDNVVRGHASASPGIMGAAMQSMLDWAHDVIGPSIIFLRVFADNGHAVAFYERLGFVKDGQIPLRRRVSGETINFVPVEAGDRAKPDRIFNRMVYAPEPRTSFQETILTAGPAISARETSYALDAARYGWNRQWAKYISRFEQTFAEYIGVKHALSTSSGTGALHLSLLALGIGPGDEVIVPDLTWVATANAVVYAGATPVFADVEPDSWCLDPKSVERLVTPRTKGIMPVHLYGHPARMDAIMEVARRHNLHIVEDAAPSIGAECLGRKTGTFGVFAMFSFQGAKLAVTGEGGMILTNDDALFQRVYTLWDQGRTPGTFWINDLGWKYKMSNIQAAIGLAQLERIDEMVEAKRRIFSWYEEGLDGVPHIRSTNRERPWARSIYWMSSIELSEDSPVSRDELRARLKDCHIDTRSVFPAISQYSFWPRRQSPQPNALRIGNQGINLPSGICLRRDQVDYVCRCIREILSGQ